MSIPVSTEKTYYFVEKEFEIEKGDDCFGVVKVMFYHYDWYNNVPKIEILDETWYLGQMSDEDIKKYIIEKVEENFYGWYELRQEAKEVV